MIIKLVIKIFFLSIDVKMTYSIIFMLIMLLKMFKNIKRV
jgi:hypothetical protein